MPSLTYAAQPEEMQPQQGNKTTISSLPAELLLLIFDFCYEDFRRDEESQPQLEDPPWHYISGGLNPSSMRPSSIAELFKRFRSPTRFPFALAGVSHFWNDLLMMEPKYWTEIIYTISSSVSRTALDKMIQQFERHPRSMPLDFIVLRDNSDPKLTSRMERNQLSTLTASYLNNHFPHLKTVAIEAGSGDSFPDIMGGWRYRATNAPSVELSTVLLTRPTNYMYQGRKYPRFQSFDQKYYELRTLSIHGLNLDGFFPSLLNGQISNLEGLLISDYAFTSDSLLFTEFLQVLATLSRLCRLKLQNITLNRDSSAGHELDDPTFTCNISELRLESMSSYATNEFYRLCDLPNVETLHLTKCTYNPSPFLQDFLILDNIKVNPLHTAQFEDDLGTWGGSELWIGRYRGSIQNILEVFRKYDQWTNDFQCPWMDTLYLYQIPNLSLKRLKKMLKTRNRGVDYSDPDWAMNTSFGPPIRKLTIDQCGIASLTKKDFDWFSSMLVEFIYIQ